MLLRRLRRAAGVVWGGQDMAGIELEADPNSAAFTPRRTKQRTSNPAAAQAPTVQMIGAGSAEFGIVSADELVVAPRR